MTWIQLYKSRKYLQRILLSIMLLMLLFLLLSSYTTLHYSEKTVLETQSAADQKVLAQINFNLSYMNEIVRNISTAIFYDDDMAPFIYGSSQEDIIRKIPKLNKLVSTYSSFVTAIVFYNGVNKAFYSDTTNALDVPSTVVLSLFKNYLNKPEEVAKMQLVPFQFDPEVEKRSVDMFSYFMFDSLGQYRSGESVLILNVKPEWIFENIRRVNNLAENDDSSIYVLNDQSEVILEDNKNTPLSGIIGPVVADNKERMRKTSDSFSYSFHGEKVLISHLTTEVNHWKVVIVQPYSVVTDNTTHLRETSIIVTVGFLLLSVILSFFVANKLYKPIEGLLRHVKVKNGEHLQELDTKDELAFVAQNFDHIVSRFQLIERSQSSTQTIVDNYRLSLLVTDSSGFMPDEIHELTQSQRLKLNLEERLVLCVIKIDDYQKFCETVQPTSRQLYYFSILNIAKELLDESFVCESINMRSDHLVMLINVADNHDDYRRMADILAVARGVVQQYYNISFTAALSHVISDYRDITAQYQTALQYSLYRIVFGQGSVIVPRMLTKQMGKEQYYTPVEWERKLVDSLKSGHLQGMNETLDAFIADISQHNYDTIINSILHMMASIKTALHEINNNKLAPITIDGHDFTRKAMEKETLGEIADLFKGLFSDISEQQAGMKDEKMSILVQAVKDIVAVNYMNPDLNVQGISSLLKMSSVYVGKVFKTIESVSLIDYIHDVRLSRALELLRTTEKSVNDIMSKVGYGNQSYFFRMFKKQYGVTPKEYRLTMTMK